MIFSVLLFGAIVYAADESMEINGDRVRVSAEEIHAEGNVSLALDGHLIQADLLDLQLSPDGVGSIRAENALWTRCLCDSPPWSVSAASAEGTIGDELILNGARFRVCDVPVLPVPRLRIPLNPRTPRVMLPEGGMIGGSPWVSLPVFVPVGSSTDLVLAPEVWIERGYRQRVGWKSPFGNGTAILGQEEVGGPLRGLFDVDGASDDGLFRAGVDSQWMSDDAYLRDFGEDYWTRSTPWAEQRMLVGVGPVRLESAMTNTDALQRPVGGTLSITGQQVGPIAFSASTRADVVQDDIEPHGGHLQRGMASFMATTGRTFGVVEADSTVQVHAVQWSDTAPRTDMGWVSRVHIPMCGEVGSIRHLASMGLEFGTAKTDGPVDRRDPWIAEPHEWSVGPTFQSQWLSSSGVPLHGEAKVLMTEDGLKPGGNINFQKGAWKAVAQGDESIQGGRIGFDDGVYAVGVGSARMEGLFQAGLNGSLSIGSGWRPGWLGVVDVLEGSVMRHGPQVIYSSPCDCFDVRMQADWAPDQTLPDALVRIDLR